MSEERKGKKPISWKNLGIGAALQVFEVSTLGQPFEVLKTHMAANRGDSLWMAIQKTWGRGGIYGFYQGLIPWAWIEASTKGTECIDNKRKYLIVVVERIGIFGSDQVSDGSLDGFDFGRNGRRGLPSIFNHG